VGKSEKCRDEEKDARSSSVLGGRGAIVWGKHAGAKEGQQFKLSVRWRAKGRWQGQKRRDVAMDGKRDGRKGIKKSARQSPQRRLD